MKAIDKRLEDLNNQAIFFCSVKDAAIEAIKELKRVYGEITWGFVAEQLQPYPYLREGLIRLRRRTK